MSALPPIADIHRRTDEVTLNEMPKGVPFHPIEPPLQYVMVKWQDANTGRVCNGFAVSPFSSSKLQLDGLLI